MKSKGKEVDNEVRRCKNCIYYAGGEGREVVCRYPFTFIKPESEELGCNFFKSVSEQLGQRRKR